MHTPHVRPASRRRGGRRRTWAARTGTVAATVVALVLTLPGTAAAAPGDLDPTFSGDGKVLTGIADDDRANDVAVQSDGKIVSVGASADYSVTESHFALTRHHTDGTPDTDFGGDGTVTTPINNMDPDLQWSEAHAVALQPDGKIVVAGTSWRGSENCCWFTVARYNTDGTLDSGFGGGDGRVFTDFGGPDEARAVAVQPDGKIVAAGSAGGQVALARYNADGSPDTGFGGGDGQVSTDPAPGLPEEGGDGQALALQSDGKIVVGVRSGRPASTSSSSATTPAAPWTPDSAATASSAPTSARTSPWRDWRSSPTGRSSPPAAAVAGSPWSATTRTARWTRASTATAGC